MPRGKKGTRKGTKKGKPAGAKRRAPRTNRSQNPAFTPTVNNSAGPAAHGLRVGFPANRTVKLDYVELLDITSVYGSLASYQFKLNSSFDPNYTGAGHQPMGFDQWAAFYNHYVVESCAYEIAILSADPSSGSQLAIHLSDDATIPSTYTTLVELGASTTLWGPYTPAHIFRGSVDMAKYFNRKDIPADDQLRAAVTADPVELMFMTILVQACNSAIASIPHRIICRLTQTVRFMEPKDLGPSRVTMRMREAEMGPGPSVAGFFRDVEDGLIDPPPEPAGFEDAKGHPYSIHDAQRIWAEAEGDRHRSPASQARLDAEAANRAAYEARARAIRAARDDQLAGPEYTLVTRKGSRSGSGTRTA